MRQVSQTRQFARDIKRMRKHSKNLNKLKAIVTTLAQGEPLEPQLKDHALSNNWQHSRDCHIEPNWLLIYTVDANSLRLERTGSHSDLFR